MRFNIAVSVLAPSLAGASVVVVEQKKKQKGALWETAEQVLLDELIIKSNNEQSNKNKKKETVLAAKKKTKPRSISTTRISSNQKTPQKKECNPDVGIFSSCGASNKMIHCIESDESTLGGFCVEYKKAYSRQLQDGGLCDDIYIDCNCDGVVDGVGSYTCTRPGECLDADGQVCGTFEDDVTVNNDGSYSSTKCFAVTSGGAVENAFDSPIESYCFTVENDGSETTSCMLKIDNVECDSCTPVLCPGGSTAENVDCTNIDPVAVGNSCGDALNILDLMAGNLTPLPTSDATSLVNKVPIVALASAVAVVALLVVS